MYRKLENTLPSRGDQLIPPGDAQRRTNERKRENGQKNVIYVSIQKGGGGLQGKACASGIKLDIKRKGGKYLFPEEEGGKYSCTPDVFFTILEES